MHRITFEQEPIYTTYQLSGMSYEVMTKVAKVIQDATCARPQGYKYMPSYKYGSWDGYIRLCKGNKFPSGLLEQIIHHLEESGLECNIGINRERIWQNKDAPLWTLLHSVMFDGITLRNYQVDATRDLIVNGSGIAWMATNSGKTEIIAAIAKILPGRSLILTTKKDILYQTAERLGMRLGEKIGIIGDGSLSVERVTVGMIQTLCKKLNDKVELGRLQNMECVMFDECHHVAAKTSQQVMLAIPAPYRFGFSGTPLSYDTLTDLILIGATGPVVVEVTNQDLIQSGISATPTVHMHTVGEEEYWEEDWQEAYGLGIVNYDARNDLIVQEIQENAGVRSVLILVERMEHGRILKSRLPFSVFVNGSDSVDDRKVALDSLRAGLGNIVIATPIFDEGVDVPAVDMIVLAGGGKGHKKLLQRIGRGMRKKEEDNRLIILDFVDQTNWHLMQHSMARAEIYEAEGFEIILK